MSAVIIEIKNGIAIVTVDNPPVNALGHGVRLGLADAVSQTDADRAVNAVVLIAAGRTFMAGADISEFGKPMAAPGLPDVVLMIEGAKKPWVAAIHGTALGGGLEVALGCHCRVADPKAKMGVPEVHLGLIPGAGGTVRLPRLVPVAKAAEMVATGKLIGAADALACGLVDTVAKGDLREVAVAFAQGIVGKDLPVVLMDRGPVDALDAEAWGVVSGKLVAKARGQNSVIRAVDAVADAVRLSGDAALNNERDIFMELMADPQSAALRHVFFAERSVGKVAAIKGVAPRALRYVGVIGGGTMGAGICVALLLSGLSVIMIERDSDALKAGQDRVAGTLTASLKRGLISADKRMALLGMFSGDFVYDSLGDVDLVIEAVFEDMDVKKQVFAELERVTRPDAVLATNTSYLDVNEIALSVADPSRVIGLHFFSPAHVMKLLEIVRPDGLADDVLATGFALGKILRKISVPAGVCDGFIGNRILSTYRRECDYMVEDGAAPQDVDAAMKAYGFPMGIFAMQDMAGLDIGWAARKRRAPTRDPKERYVKIADRICKLGRFGQKTGSGWFTYPEGSRRGEPDPIVEAIILEESAGNGVTRRSFNADEIMTRILGAMESEGQAILAEGIAQSSEAIDVVMINGYGFPRHKGGPMFAAEQGAN
ncbi:MAG: 3-hydroxyacyl-CoA dehydrogenase NAD-binding domain-containing protein [Amylibacter sp.]